MRQHCPERSGLWHGLVAGSSILVFNPSFKLEKPGLAPRRDVPAVTSRRGRPGFGVPSALID